jgi:hypothetical protein
MLSQAVRPEPLTRGVLAFLVKQKGLPKTCVSEVFLSYFHPFLPMQLNQENMRAVSLMAAALSSTPEEIVTV